MKEIISQQAIEQAYQTWLDEIHDEIDYWNAFLSTRGDAFGERGDFNWRMDSKNRFPNEGGMYRGLNKLVEDNPQSKVRLLDVGSGPLTVLGQKSKSGKEIEVVACDPLAPVYNAIMDKHGIVPPIKSTFADAENLSLFFEPNSFDAAGANNALDHSYNPMVAIINMVHVVRVGGAVYLSHFENEAENGGYLGLHQWNFSVEGLDMIIWNKTHRFSLQELLGDCATVAARNDEVEIANKPPWVRAVITKEKDVPFELLNDLKIKYTLAVNAITMKALELIENPPLLLEDILASMEKKLEQQQDSLTHTEKELKRKVRSLKNLILLGIATVIAAFILLK